MTNPWAVLDDARAPGLWPDAGTIPDETLQTCLDTAYEVCVVFAPVLASGDPVPVRYTQATVLQAREHWGGYRTGPGGTVGLDAYAITPKPMTAAVRLLLRPRSGRPQAAIGVDP